MKATADGVSRHVAKPAAFAVCADVFMQTDSKVILHHVTMQTLMESHGAGEDRIPTLHQLKMLWIAKLNVRDSGHRVSLEAFGLRGGLPMKNCSAMLCTRMWSNGITHSLPKFAASFKASTSYTKRGYVSLEEPMKAQKRPTFWLILRCFAVR